MSNEPTRLNKFLASGGVGSRRQCDALVQAGEVTINGEVCLSPGTRVGEDDVVRHGRHIITPRQTQLLLLNKPRGLVCTKDDEFRRETIYDLLPHKLHHLNHVGRLDQDSEGLLLLTNDGDLAQRLSHPGHQTEKEYIVTAGSAISDEVLDKFLVGLFVGDLGRLKAKAVRRLSPRRASLVLETGLKRQIREMFKALHLRVTKLVRVRIGSLTAPDLPPGRYRALTEEEAALLSVNPPPAKSHRHKPGQSGPARKKPARKSAKTTGSRRGASKGGSGRKSAPPKGAPRKSARKGAARKQSRPGRGPKRGRR